jgi:hypothetical protein
MKYSRFVVALAALVPSLVYAQNQQVSDCRSIEAAGNFVGADEAVVNGFVCKVKKPKTNSAASTQAAAKATERSEALLGIIEPETLRSKDKAGASSEGTSPTPGAIPGAAANDSAPGGAPQSPVFEIVPAKSLGEIAREYRKKAAARKTAGPEEGDLEGKKSTDEVERVVLKSPAAARKVEIIAVAPPTVLSTPAKTPRTAKNEVIAVPQAQPDLVKPETSPATAGPLQEPAVMLETNSPAIVGTSTSAPEVRAPAQTEIAASEQRIPAKEQTATSAVPAIEEEVREPQPQRSLGVGAFAVSQPPDTNPPAQLLANTTAEDIAFKEGQASTCIKNISLGSMDKDKLFLAIPEWALKWHEKNQKRFPGICFSDSLMPGTRNYLIVFYTAAPQVAGTESLARISAPGETTPVSGMGGFTTSYGSTWHYTFEGTVTTTITSVSAEKAPHNQASTLLYVTAYSEKGIPISHHWPVAATKSDEKSAAKSRKNQDASLPAVRGMEELLNQAVTDIAKM